MKKIHAFILLIIAVSFALAFYLYPRMPETMASHWNYRGEVNGYMSKFWGLFLMPILAAGMFVLFLLIPKIDPLQENVAKFRKYFDNFILMIEIFFFYLYLLTIFWNQGVRFDMNAMLLPAFGVLFYFAGVMIENARPNWFIGIRTPWTLSSEAVWNKTHRVGGKLFKAAGAFSLLGVLVPSDAIFFMLIPVLLVSIYLTVYSYVEFQKEKKGKG